MSMPFGEPEKRYIHRKMTKVLKPLNKEHEAITSQKHAVKARRISGSLSGVIAALDAATKTIQVVGENGAEAIAGMVLARLKKTETCRAFIEDHGITHEAEKPNVLNTIMVSQGCILLEGMVTAGLMLADGKMDTPVAITYGLSVAGINVLAGLATGFFPARFIGYRWKAPYSWTRDRLIRIAAWCGLGGMISLMGVLNFSAARVRATGEHHGIFNFDTVGFWDTFNDYYSVGILTIGFIGGLIAIYEGYKGIKDSVPGYTRVWKAAETQVNTATQDVYDRFLDMAEDTYENAKDSAQNHLDDIDGYFEAQDADIADLVKRITAHNHKVESARQSIRDLVSGIDGSLGRISEGLKATEIEWSAFDALLIDIPDMPAPVYDADTKQSETLDVKSAIARLEQAYHEACAKIEQAYAGYLAEIPNPLNQ